MARAAKPPSSQSSQSSLSQLPSDEEEEEQSSEMRTRAKTRRIVQMEEEEEEDDEDEMISEEEEEEIADDDGSIDDEEEELNGAIDGSASEDDEVVAPSTVKGKTNTQVADLEEEENDELDESSSAPEDEELEQGDGEDYKGKGKRRRASKPVQSTRKTPRRSAVSNRKAITELSRSASEESEEDEIQTTPATKGTRKITIRLSPSKNGRKGRVAAKNTAVKEKRPKRGKAKRVQEEEEEEEDELEDDEEGIDGMAEGSDSFDEFENDQSFLSLPKTARQLAKQRENQGIDSTSELQELPMEESKKAKLTESEIALRKSEMARRRRNQTEKKLEDDKIETINRLLKKQVSRRSNRDKTAVEESEAEAEDEEMNGTTEKKIVDPKQVRLDLKQLPADFFRYIQTANGSSLSLPVEETEHGIYKNAWEERLFPSTKVQAKV